MKTTSLLKVLTGLLAVLLLANCGDDSSGEGPTLTVSPGAIVLDDSGRGTLTVNSNTQWTVRSADSWLNCSPGGATGGSQVTLTASINNTGSDRSTVLTFTDKSNTKTVSVTVTQKPAGSPEPEPEASLTVSPTTLSFTADGGSNKFTITSNVSWMVTTSETWCTVSPTSGTGNNDNVKVTVSANSTTTSRSATITITGGSITRTIQVTQDAKGYTLSVSPTSLSFAAAGETKNVTVSSNDSWTVTSDQTWCTVSPSSGSNDGTVKVTAAANSSSTSRTATVTIKGQNSGSKTVSVTQEAGSSKPSSIMVLGEFLEKPFGYVEGVNLKTDSYMSLRNKLAAMFTLRDDSSDPTHVESLSIYSDDNEILKDYTYWGVPCTYLYVGDTMRYYSFRITKDKLSDPYPTFKRIVQDFNNLGFSMTYEIVTEGSTIAKSNMVNDSQARYWFALFDYTNNYTFAIYIYPQ
jgi:hypothetical protein